MSASDKLRPGTRVRIQIGWDCPGTMKSHGTPELVNGHRGIVLGDTPAPDAGHPVKVGLEWGFSYFTEAELR